MVNDCLYNYTGIITRVIDGDTIQVNVDLGFRINREIRVRLIGVNAPEVYGKNKEEGLRVAEALASLLGENRPCRIRTYRDKLSFDRYLADTLIEMDGRIVNLSEVVKEML